MKFFTGILLWCLGYSSVYCLTTAKHSLETFSGTLENAKATNVYWCPLFHRTDRTKFTHYSPEGTGRIRYHVRCSIANHCSGNSGNTLSLASYSDYVAHTMVAEKGHPIWARANALPGARLARVGGRQMFVSPSSLQLITL